MKRADHRPMRLLAFAGLAALAMGCGGTSRADAPNSGAQSGGGGEAGIAARSGSGGSAGTGQGVAGSGAAGASGAPDGGSPDAGAGASGLGGGSSEAGMGGTADAAGLSGSAGGAGIAVDAGAVAGSAAEAGSPDQDAGADAGPPCECTTGICCDGCHFKPKIPTLGLHVFSSYCFGSAVSACSGRQVVIEQDLRPLDCLGNSSTATQWLGDTALEYKDVPCPDKQYCVDTGLGGDDAHCVACP